MSAEQNSKKPATPASPTPSKPSAPAGGTGGAPSSSSSSSSSRGPASKVREALPGQCFAVSCKKPDQRMSFCDEHYEHFKFGLINRKGEPVPDFEKKFEHYQAHLKRRSSALKAA
ncbi:MAG: hypothetical protein AAB425_00540 [Bdellovibrionota bacterium]